LFVRTAIGSTVGTADYAANSANTILVTTSSVTTEIGVIPATDGTLVYKFDGDAVKVPAKAWTSEDTVSATLVFTFVPQAVENSNSD
jgi:hypothetical protein